jgi:hypothetical protein
MAIKKHNTYGDTVAISEYTSVNDIILSDLEWEEEQEFLCEIIVNIISDSVISLYYFHEEFSDGDTAWIILRSEVTEQEWAELVDHYKDFLHDNT